MAQAPEDAWIDEEPDLPPPEPAPAGWAPPTPEAPAQVTVETPTIVDEAPDFKAPPSKARRFWITTLVYGLLFVAANALIHAGQPFWAPLVFLVPLYLLTLPFVLHTPKRKRHAKAKLAERVDWQRRLMISVVVFLALYVPFTFVSSPLLPYASLVEYCLFALLLFVLLRLGGRGAGVAPSLDALPPPTHRLHQQVVAPIDDAHYQRTLWLNYSFVERGRGTRHLLRRFDEILDANGIAPERRAAVLAELHDYDEGGFRLGRRGRDRRESERDRRAQVLERIYASLNQELEIRA